MHMVLRNKCPCVNNVTDTSGTSVLIQDRTTNMCLIQNLYKTWTCMTMLSNFNRKFCTIIQTCVNTILLKTFNSRNRKSAAWILWYKKVLKILHSEKKLPQIWQEEKNVHRIWKLKKNYRHLFILKNKSVLPWWTKIHASW